MEASFRVALARLGLVSMLFVSGCAIRPALLASSEQSAQARADLERMFSGQPPLNAPLAFHEAVVRAVQYNLDHRLRLLEQTMADERVVGARLDLLPRLLLNDEYYGRSKEPASVSESLATGEESLEASISSRRYGRRADLALAWNVLDFGVSYVRASQEANRALIARERRAKAVQDLVLDVRRAYWRAVGAQRLIPEVDALLGEVRAALKDSEILDAEGLLDPLEALSYQRALIERARDLGNLRRSLEVSRIELASLVNAQPGEAFELVAYDADELPMPELDLPIEKLEVAALASRPELREVAYEKRIGRLEVKRAMLRILPGLEFRIGRNQDDNDFLVNEDWFSYSALLSKNLIEIFTAPSQIRLAQTGLEVNEGRRLATSMAVLAQVHIAHANFFASRDGLRFAERARAVEGRMREVTAERVAGESETELGLLQRAASHLATEVDYHLAYADLQEAYGRLLNSIGVLPPLGEEDVEDTERLIRHLRAAIGDTEETAVAAPPPAGEAPSDD